MLRSVLEIQSNNKNEPASGHRRFSGETSRFRNDAWTVRLFALTASSGLKASRGLQVCSPQPTARISMVLLDNESDDGDEPPTRAMKPKGQWARVLV